MSDATTRSKARRALKEVDKELKQHLTSALDILDTHGFISLNVTPSAWALEVETRDGVRVRFESGAPSPVTRRSVPVTISSPPTSSDARKQVTKAQRATIIRLRDSLGLTEIGGYPLSDTAIADLDDLEGSLPRTTASAIITALETTGAAQGGPQ